MLVSSSVALAIIVHKEGNLQVKILGSCPKCSAHQSFIIMITEQFHGVGIERYRSGVFVYVHNEHGLTFELICP